MCQITQHFLNAASTFRALKVVLVRPFNSLNSDRVPAWRDVMDTCLFGTMVGSVAKTFLNVSPQNKVTCAVSAIRAGCVRSSGLEKIECVDTVGLLVARGSDRLASGWLFNPN